MESIRKEILNIVNNQDIVSNNLKSLKFNIHNIDNVINELSSILIEIKNIKKIQCDKLLNSINNYGIIINNVENKMGIKTSVNESKKDIIEEEIDIGQNIIIKNKLYVNKEAISIMNYGIIKQPETGKKIMVFRYGIKDFVSCSSINISDYNNSTYFRTICCLNAAKCQYGSNCKFYHDPIISPHSNHVQKFMKSHIIPLHPYFGHSTNFNETLKSIKFEDVHTLARYCAVMMLLINKVADKS